MTLVETRDTGDITRDVNRAARDAWRDSGRTMTGPQVAAMFPYEDGQQRSAAWGRKQIRAARDEDEARHGGLRAVPDPGVTPAAVTAPAKRHAPPSRVTRRAQAADVAVRRVTVLAVTLVAAVAAAASYAHMHTLALEAGEGTMARALPLSVDGLVVVASMTLLSARRAGRAAGALPWLALCLGLGASLAANIAAAEPTLVGRMVAAWPPLALALAFELLLRQTRGEP